MWPALRHAIRRHHPGLLTGALVGTSYIPFPPWAVLLCWVPLWQLLRRQVSWTEAFRQGWIAQCVLTLIGFHWIAPTVHEFAALPWPVAVAVLAGFAAGAHLFIPVAFALTAWLATRLRLGLPTALATAALLHALGERAWPMIFPWNLGYTLLWAGIPAYQWADTIGFLGVSTVLLLANAWLTRIWINYRQQRPVQRDLLLVTACTLGVVATGYMKGARARPRPDDPRLQLLVVQANIGGAARRDAARAGRDADAMVLASFLSLTEAGLRRPTESPPDAILWPEVAFPRNVGAPLASFGMSGRLATALARWGTPLITGGYVLQDTTVYNALTVVSTDGTVSDPPHTKSVLLPFGEVLPGRQLLPGLSRLLPAVGLVGRGDGPRTLKLPLRTDTLTVGAQICYEGLFPGFSRRLGELGAQLLVNVANDSWFGGGAEAQQHLIMTMARGIELRRPVVRSTNTGITSAMDASGQLYGQSPLNAAWHGRLAVPYRVTPPATAWQRFGHRDWMLWTTVLAVLLLRGAQGRRAARHDQGSPDDPNAAGAPAGRRSTVGTIST
jgi:apolipoprotein N-acyltransferase